MPIDNTTTQQTRNICITFVQCWANVEDVETALYKCYTNVLCLLVVCNHCIREVVPLKSGARTIDRVVNYCVFVRSTDQLDIYFFILPDLHLIVIMPLRINLNARLYRRIYQLNRGTLTFFMNYFHESQRTLATSIQKHSFCYSYSYYVGSRGGSSFSVRGGV